MAYNNNQKDAQTNVNTKGFQFNNKDGFDPSTLQVGFWNDFVSIRMSPALEPSKQTEKKIFDYDKVISTSLTPEKTMTFILKIAEDILPAIKNDEAKSVGIQVGAAGDTIVAISTGKAETGSIKPMLIIYKGIDPETHKPEMSIGYEFKTISTVDEYDPKTGKYSVCKNIHAEFALFIQFLKDAVAGLSNSVAHSERTVNKWQNDKMTSTINAIAEKNGVSTNSGFGSGYKSFRSSVSFDSDSSSGSTEDSNQQETLNNLDDINAFME